MITTLRNSLDYVYAYVESNRVDKDGCWNKTGNHVRIENFWIHEKYRGRRVLTELVCKLNDHPVYRECEWVYWGIMRNSNKEKIIDDMCEESTELKLSKLYKKDELVKKLKGEVLC